MSASSPAAGRRKTSVLRLDRSRSRRDGLQDRVADNVHKWEITESETLLFGRKFGVGTDVHTGPNGNLYRVSP